MVCRVESTFNPSWRPPVCSCSSLPNLQVHLVRGEAGHLLCDLGLEQHVAVEEGEHLDGVGRVHLPHDVLHGVDELALFLGAVERER